MIGVCTPGGRFWFGGMGRGSGGGPPMGCGPRQLEHWRRRDDGDSDGRHAFHVLFTL